MKRSTCVLTLVALVCCAGIGRALERDDRVQAPATKQASLRTAAVQANWPSDRVRTYRDMIHSLDGQQLTAQVVVTGAQEVIVFYDKDGNCRVCLGSAKACKEACSAE